MKVLLDTCVWGGVYNSLRDAGYDVIWVGHWEKDLGDREIMDLAYQEKRIIVTLDKDFGELAVLHELPHYGIIRLVNFSAPAQAEICKKMLMKYGAELVTGAIVTAEPGRVRIRSSIS